MTMADISRRRFVQAMGAVSATSVLRSPAATASAPARPAATRAAPRAAPPTPSPLPRAPTRAASTPAFVDDGESAKIMCNIYDTLLNYDTESCDIVPGLADLPEISDDGLVYTFKLQEGVKFHDGTDCNAEAVKKNIDRQLEPNRTADMPYAGFVLRSRGLQQRRRLRRGPRRHHRRHHPALRLHRLHQEHGDGPGRPGRGPLGLRERRQLPREPHRLRPLQVRLLGRRAKTSSSRPTRTTGTPRTRPRPRTSSSASSPRTPAA